jgi:hypothetical protein
MTHKLTVSDVRKAGFCVKGLKEFYELQGFEKSFKDFLREGMDLEEMRVHPDPQIKRAVEFADRRIAGEIV